MSHDPKRLSSSDLRPFTTPLRASFRVEKGSLQTAHEGELRFPFNQIKIERGEPSHDRDRCSMTCTKGILCASDIARPARNGWVEGDRSMFT
jgi:hypothetical protein